MSLVLEGNGPSAGLDLDVASIAPQPDGRIGIGGAFATYNRVSRNSVARLMATGSLDTTFNPGSGANYPIEAVALQPDGKVIVAGRFTSFNGMPRDHIARLTSDGALDMSFDPPGGVNDLVAVMVLQPDGKILIGGPFTAVNGLARNYLARLNANGQVDTTFAPAAIDRSVQAIALQADGRILIAGIFTSVDGLTRNRIARLNANGSMDNTFDPGVGANDLVDTISLQTDGSIIVGGTFTIIGGTNRNYV